MDSLADELLDYQPKSYKELTADYESIEEVPLASLAKYAAEDAWVTLRLYHPLKEQLEKLEEPQQASLTGNSSDNLVSQRKLLEEIEHPLVGILAQMERNGIAVDSGVLGAQKELFESEVEKLRTTIHEEAGKEFNLNSPKQLSAILYEDLGLPTTGIKKRAGGHSTDHNSLEKLHGKHSIIEHLLDYREVHKLLTTYINGLGKLVDEKTERIYGSFNQCVTATGRLSSTDPNLQNIPIRSERGRAIRRAFVSAKGCKLIVADYSQIELRILAHLSEDAHLVEAYSSGADIHQATAEQLFSGNHDLDPKTKRRMAKTINFGVIYGIGPFRLARDLQISRTDAKTFIDSYFDRYSGVRDYFEQLEFEMDTRGYVETIMGRRRYVSEFRDSGRDPGYLKRSLANFPLQGSAADLIKKAMIKISREIAPEDAKIVSQVHDELLVEVREEVAEEVSERVKSLMESSANLIIPLEADVAVVDHWGAAK